MEDIKASIDSIDIFQKKYKPESPLVAIMQSHKNSLVKAYQQSQKAFAKTESDLRLDCARAFRNKVLGDEVDELIGIGEPLMWDIADSGYVMEIERNKNKYKRIVLFVGTGHAGAVNQYLEKIGAKCVNRIGSESKFKLAHPETKSIFRILNGCFARMAGSRESLVLTSQVDAIQPESLPNVVQDEKIKETCRLCQKSVEAMKRCGACKVAKYCSAECQKKDWKEHKKVCSSSVKI